MAYRLEFSLAVLPKTTNHNLGHWTVRNKRAKMLKAMVMSKVLIMGKPEKPLKQAKLSLFRYSSMECDFDGLVSSFKHIIDGLVRGEVLVNDKRENIGQPSYEWVKAPPGMGRIRVVVEEL